MIVIMISIIMIIRGDHTKKFNNQTKKEKKERKKERRPETRQSLMKTPDFVWWQLGSVGKGESVALCKL